MLLRLFLMVVELLVLVFAGFVLTVLVLMMLLVDCVVLVVEYFIICG